MKSKNENIIHQTREKVFFLFWEIEFIEIVEYILQKRNITKSKTV